MSDKKKNTVIINAYEDCWPADPSEAEKTLLKAVLSAAMSDLEKTGHEYKDAVRFFLSTEKDYLFSFESICSHLKVDPKHVLLLTGLSEDPEFMVAYNRLRRTKTKTVDQDQIEQ